MFERFTRHAIEMLILCAIVVGLAVMLWNAIPGIIKIIVIALIVGGFISMLKGK